MPKDNAFYQLTPEVSALTELALSNSRIDPSLYEVHQVNRGLRDLKGNGVLTGLTEISEINAFKMIDGVKTPCEGELYYRGVKIEDLVDGFMNEDRFGFEEVTYLLLFGELPTVSALESFKGVPIDNFWRVDNPLGVLT